MAFVHLVDEVNTGNRRRYVDSKAKRESGRHVRVEGLGWPSTATAQRKKGQVKGVFET